MCEYRGAGPTKWGSSSRRFMCEPAMVRVTCAEALPLAHDTLSSLEIHLCDVIHNMVSFIETYCA